MARRVKDEDKYKVINGIKHKLCSTCKEYRPITEFSSRKASPDGLAYSCKDCERKTAQASYKRRQKKKLAQKYYQENRDKIIEREKARYANNKEVHLARGKEWREANKEKVNAASQRRRERIKEQTPGGVDYVREEIIERDSVGGMCICQICGKPIKDMAELQIDHIIPIAAGGSDTRDNVRCTHRTCNLIRPKDGKDLEA